MAVPSLPNSSHTALAKRSISLHETGDPAGLVFLLIPDLCKCPRPMNKECSGFTLLELLVVLIIVGILAVNAVVRWPPDSELKLPAQAELLASHLRHMQLLAMYWGQPLQLTVTGGSYSVSCVTAAATPPCDSSPVLDPVTGKSFTTTLESGISLSGTTTEFNVFGIPVSGSTPLTGTPPRRFTLSAGSDTWKVDVAELTGFVSTSP